MIEPKIGDVWVNKSISKITAKVVNVEPAIVLFVTDKTTCARYGYSAHIMMTDKINQLYTLVERDDKTYEHVPQGEELIGHLCLVSSHVFGDELKHRAEKYDGLVVAISDYKEDNIGKCHISINETIWRYAYPIKINGEYVKVDMSEIDGIRKELKDY
jgi:hypothetical protein